MQNYSFLQISNGFSLKSVVPVLTTRNFTPITTTSYANSFHNSAIFLNSSIFSTLQLYGKYSTLFVFEPPTQNTL